MNGIKELSGDNTEMPRFTIILYVKNSNRIEQFFLEIIINCSQT